MEFSTESSIPDPLSIVSYCKFPQCEPSQRVHFEKTKELQYPKA